MKKILFIFAALIVFVCLSVSVFFLWRNYTPAAFPVRVAGLMRVDGPQVRKEFGCDNCKEFYAAVYSPQTYNVKGEQQIRQDESILLSARNEGTEQAAKELIRSNRESIKKDIERNAKSSTASDETHVKFDASDKDQDDFIAFTRNGTATVIWVSGSWSYMAYGTAEKKTKEDGGGYSATPLLYFVGDLSYAPQGMPKAEGDSATLFYLFQDFKAWAGYWYPVLIPILLSLPFLLLMFIVLLRARKSLKTVTA